MSILEKPARDLSAADYARIEKPLGKRVPYPGMGLGYIIGRNGEKKLTRYLGVLDKPLMVTSERDLDEVEGMLIRNMPTPEMLKLFYEVMSALNPRNERRAMYLKGAPGVGKTFLFELAGSTSSKKGAIKIDCTNMNLNELFFETVLDFKGNQRFYDALNDKVEKYNKAHGSDRDAILNPMSIDILRDCLGSAFSEEKGRICIDWAAVKNAHRNDKDEALDMRASIEIAIAGLKKVSSQEGLDSLGGNALGMATQEGPAWQAYKEGRVLILDELNRAKRGTFGILHGWMQFVIGEIKECKVRNPLKEKGDQSKAELHFKRDEMAAGYFVAMTGNTEDDSDEVLELPEALSSRVVPDPIARATLQGWQHRWCQILTGMPISTLYYAQKDVWDRDPAAFTRKLREWRELRETREVPQHQINMLRRWPDILQATENLAKFMESAAKTIDPDSDWHKAGTLTQLLDDLSETFKKQVSVDFRKITYFITKASQPKPSVRPPQDENGPDIVPLIGAMDMAETAEDIKHKLGTYLSYVILDWIISNTFEVGKADLGKQLMRLAADCALVDPNLIEGMPSSRKTIADCLDENPFDSTDPDIRVEFVRDMLCDYLRDLYPDIRAENTEIMPASVVRRAIEELAERGPGIAVFNSDPDSVSHRPLREAYSVEMTPQAGEGYKQPDRPGVEELLSQYALLATFAAPELRERNLASLWNDALSNSGAVSYGGQDLVDASLAMAENKSATGVAATTVIVRQDNAQGAAKELPMHIVWNRKMDRLLVVGEGEISKKLRQAFNDARVVYIDRSDQCAPKALRSGMSFVLGAEAKTLCDTVRNAFLMRNKMNDESTEPGLHSLSRLLLSDDLQCYLPHYIAQRAP